MYERQAQQMERVVLFPLEFLQCFVQPLLHEPDSAEIVMGARLLRVELEGLFQRRLRLLEETDKVAPPAEGSMDLRAQRIDQRRPPEQRDGFIPPAEKPGQDRRVAQRISISGSELDRTTKKRVCRLPVPVVVHANPAHRELRLRTFRLEPQRLLRRVSRFGKAFADG